MKIKRKGCTLRTLNGNCRATAKQCKFIPKRCTRLLNKSKEEMVDQICDEMFATGEKLKETMGLSDDECKKYLIRGNLPKGKGSD